MTEHIREIDAIALKSPGAMLARLRKARDLSVEDVAQRLKYGQRQLEALERNEFSKLHGMTFVRGMIRGYARLLGVDPSPILRELEEQNGPNASSVDIEISRIPFPDGRRQSTRIYAVLSTGLIIVAMLVGYEVLPWPIDLTGSMSVATQSVVEQTPIASVETLIASPGAAMSDTAMPSSVLSEPDTFRERAVTAIPKGVALTSSSVSVSRKIELAFEKDSWVEIKQSDGKILLSQLNRGGSEQIVEGVPPFTVVIGNAPNVRLSYNEQQVDLRPHFKVDVARLTLE